MCVCVCVCVCVCEREREKERRRCVWTGQSEKVKKSVEELEIMTKCVSVCL